MMLGADENAPFNLQKIPQILPLVVKQPLLITDNFYTPILPTAQSLRLACDILI